MMILRPVSPASPSGPPMTKRPVGLMWYLVFLSSMPAGMMGRMTFSRMPSRTVSIFTASLCLADTTTLSTPPPAGVHAHGEVRGLFLARDKDGAAVGVEAPAGVGVADAADSVAGNLGVIEVGFGGDLARHHRQPGRHQRLAGHAAVQVLLQHGVEHRVGNLVGDLVRVPFGDRFRSEKIALRRRTHSASV